MSVKKTSLKELIEKLNEIYKDYPDLNCVVYSYIRRPQMSGHPDNLRVAVAPYEHLDIRIDIRK